MRQFVRLGGHAAAQEAPHVSRRPPGGWRRDISARAQDRHASVPRWPRLTLAIYACRVPVSLRRAETF
ncbi:hypothetical protein BED46_020135 [Burkholderia contaminans]|nr:hypothetical protein [Burkholderia contaminans]OMI80560.1 hypothetical protein BED46_020135 [Burkholderia contaminans]